MKKFGAIMLVLGLMTMGLVLVPNATAPPTGIDLSVGKYTLLPANYVPTEEITITIDGPETDKYNISIRDWPGGTEWKLWTDKSPDSNEVLTLQYTIPGTHADGQYRVYVCDFGVSPCDQLATPWWEEYTLQLWEIDIETDRGDVGTFLRWDNFGDLGDGSYLPNEVVTVSYVITYRKNHMPVEKGDGFLDWFAIDNTGAVIASDYDRQVDGIGTFTFDLGSADQSDDRWDDYQVRAWFNDTPTADNTDDDMEYFYVGGLGVDVDLSGATYAPGDQVMVEVTLFVDMGDATANGVWDNDEHEVIPGTPLDPSVDNAEVAIDV
ncbi:MAG: hypothetical protein KAI64_05250, partial [Thermoplasmata archaeon]|nr:hypothetical protein [Thermoplasmata archaeon]